MSAARISLAQFKALTGGKPPARGMKKKPFALAAKPAKTKHRSAAQWLAIYRATPPRPAESPTVEQQKALFDAHDPIVYRLWLPLSPSNNHLKQIRKSWKNGKMKAWLAPTAAAEAYPIAVAEAWNRMWNGHPPRPLPCRIRLLITVHPPREGSDIFNREKALSDALTACKVWIDDKQIDFGGIARGKIVKPAGAMDVIIETLEAV